MDCLIPAPDSSKSVILVAVLYPLSGICDIRSTVLLIQMVRMVSLLLLIPARCNAVTQDITGCHGFILLCLRQQLPVIIQKPGCLPVSVTPARSDSASYQFSCICPSCVRKQYYSFLKFIFKSYSSDWFTFIVIKRTVLYKSIAFAPT